MSEQSNVNLAIPTENLIKRKSISGTPFEVTSMIGNGSFINLANIKLSDTFNTEEEALEHYKTNAATIIVTACTTISQMQVDKHITDTTELYGYVPGATKTINEPKH